MKFSNCAFFAGGKTLDSAEMLQRMRADKQARLIAEENPKRADVATGIISGTCIKY